MDDPILRLENGDSFPTLERPAHDYEDPPRRLLADNPDLPAHHEARSEARRRQLAVARELPAIRKVVSQ